MRGAKLRQVYISGFLLVGLLRVWLYDRELLPSFHFFELKQSPLNLTISNGSLVFIGA